MALTDAQIRQIEEIHIPVEKLLPFGPTGEDCEWVDVCEACDDDTSLEAVLFPCPALQAAQEGYEDYDEA